MKECCKKKIKEVFDDIEKEFELQGENCYIDLDKLKKKHLK